MQNLLDLHSRLRWAQSVILSLSWCVLCSSTIACRQYDAAVVLLFEAAYLISVHEIHESTVYIGVYI